MTRTKMSIEAKAANDSQVAIRLPATIVERVEAHAAKLARQHPGLVVRRADAFRMLLHAALDDAERDASAGTSTTRLLTT